MTSASLRIGQGYASTRRRKKPTPIRKGWVTLQRAGEPRFDVVTTDGTVHYVRSNSPLCDVTIQFWTLGHFLLLCPRPVQPQDRIPASSSSMNSTFSPHASKTRTPIPDGMAPAPWSGHHTSCAYFGLLCRQPTAARSQVTDSERRATESSRVPRSGTRLAKGQCNASASHRR